MGQAMWKERSSGACGDAGHTRTGCATGTHAGSAAPIATTPGARTLAVAEGN